MLLKRLFSNVRRLTTWLFYADWNSKALQWTGHYERRTQNERRTQKIANIIYELTGELRSRKQVSTHIFVLQRFKAAPEPQQYARIPPWTQLSYTPYYANVDAFPARSTKPLPPNYLALMRTNRTIRTEVSPYLRSKFRFDFLDDINALRAVCSSLSPTLLHCLGGIHLEIIGGYGSPLDPITGFVEWLQSTLPHLSTLSLTLHGQPKLDAGEERGGLGYDAFTILKGVTNLNIRIVLHLQWAAYCESFEKWFEGCGWTKVSSGERLIRCRQRR